VILASFPPTKSRSRMSTATHCNKHTAAHYNTLQHEDVLIPAVRCVMVVPLLDTMCLNQMCIILHHTATHCNTLRHATTTNKQSLPINVRNETRVLVEPFVGLRMRYGVTTTPQLTAARCIRRAPYHYFNVQTISQRETWNSVQPTGA